MKKIVLVALVAATSAFAWTDGKSMVELNDCFDGNRCENFDINMANDDEEDNELESTTIALNYNWLFTNNFGAGLKYVTTNTTRDGDVDSVGNESNTVGVNLFWNFDGGWESAYAALRYDMTANAESQNAAGDDQDDATDITSITLEYGKRMQMGKVFGLGLHYAPSVSYTMMTTESDESGVDDVDRNELRLNVANFAVAF